MQIQLITNCSTYSSWSVAHEERGVCHEHPDPLRLPVVEALVADDGRGVDAVGHGEVQAGLDVGVLEMN